MRKEQFLIMGMALAVVSAAEQRSQPQIDSSHLHARVVARENWQAQGRRIPGLNSAALRHRAIQQKLQMRVMQFASSTTASGSWTLLGPLPLPSDASGSGIQDYSWVSGRATAVAIDPNDPTGNTVFAGGAYAGVWKSTNAGVLSTDPSSVLWTPLTDTQATLAIGSIAVQPQLSNPNPAASIVLAGTGETNSSADSYYGLGILRSADAGQTWNLISQDAGGTHSFAGLGFSKIAFSTANPSLVVAAAASASQGIVEALENPVALTRGLYYSADAGLTWQFANLADAGLNISPSSVSALVYNPAAGMFFAAVRFHGFYSSSDGANWTRLPVQPGLALTASSCPAQTAQPSTCPIYRGELAVVPNRPGPNKFGEMYAWFVDANDNDQGIWQSLDRGASWTQINDSGITNCGDLFGGCGTAQGSYNLSLAAVPDGTATDIYAGAVNLYKCVITNAFPSCNGTGKNSFVNLTHVYGCSDISKVHPDQHAIDSLGANGTALMYFANDGGIYRALDGFTGLTSGTCGQSNQFDSLNATLGPMTQFVSIAQSSVHPDLLFGGTQDNGAPATAFSQSGGSWVNVDAGDNGYTAVNPANENEWFVASPPDSISGVNLFRCPDGIGCDTQDFANHQVADSNQVGGDTGAFYLPFILDPAGSGAILLGTCRIWRGSSSGGNFSVLSPDFETGGSGACTGTEVNLVRSLTAGGPTDSSGYSQVIYAATNGYGPLISTTPIGGHVWVTTSADAGPTSWADRTSGINPNGFPISAIAIDPADPSGKTAYVAIMGFHTSHVWRTKDAGVSWTDFSGTTPNSLPDAPVNSVAIVPDAAGTTIYVGSDVGVFASSTSSPSWSELNPVAGQPGFLPNVAVTELRYFNSGGLKRLRAATYGRGLWEWDLITTPDFQLTVSNNPQTIVAGSTGKYNGKVFARNGYSSSVNLTCTAGNTSPPPTCAVTPASVVPSAGGAAYTINATGPAGDYLFNLHALGTDASAISHDLAFTLHVTDFTLSTPSPASISVAPGATSSSASLTVSPVGNFTGLIALSCAGLPAGATCLFTPSNVVTPTSGVPATLTLTVSTLPSTPLSTSQVTISAASQGAITKTQSFTLIVGATPDYTLSISNSPQTVQANTTAVFQGTLTAVNGYSSTVVLSCGEQAPPNCAVNPANVTPTASGTAFTINASSSTAQNYSFSVNATGNDPASLAHSAPIVLTVLPAAAFDFSMGVNPQSASVPVGQSTTYTVDVNPGTASFPSNVTFSCSNLPALTTCTFNPSQVGAGSGNSTAALTLTTTAPGHALSSGTIALLSFPIFGFLCLGPPTGRSRYRVASVLCIALVIVASVSCGGGLQGNGTAGAGTANPGTPKGTYNITVTATCGSVNHSSTISLTVN